jgi:putative DNA-invertase from lambdoid prophage Rac
MSRMFGYGRVSTSDQHTDNQLFTLKQKGFDIQENRWFSESISAGVPALKRPIFSKMTDRMEAGDTLIVLKLDRLGRDVIDVLSTIDTLRDSGIHVLSLDLEGVDLSSAAGKLHLTVLAAVAAFEKTRIRERTMEGLTRSNKKAGRPIAIDTTRKVQDAKKRGLSQGQIVKELGLSIATVKRHWKK